MARVGFVGLGVMGAPMAGHLVRAGHSVTVWNRTASKAEPLRDQGAAVAGSLAELAAGQELICLCLSRSEDVLAVAADLMPFMEPGAILVDHSTIEPSAAETLYTQAKAAGLESVDAPITGGSMGAQAGTLTIFCGGEESVVERILPTIQAYAKRAERVGGPSFGQKMKLANQIAVGGALLGLCESLAFAQKAGLNLEQAHAMIGAGAGGSWAFANYGPKLLAKDWKPGFSIDNQVKDFDYTESMAGSLRASVPLTEVANKLLKQLQADGHGDWTTCALFDLLARE